MTIEIGKFRVEVIVTPANHGKQQHIVNMLEWAFPAFLNEIGIEKASGDIFSATRAKAIHIWNLDAVGQYTIIENKYPKYIDHIYDIQIYIKGMLNDSYKNLPS